MKIKEKSFLLSKRLVSIGQHCIHYFTYHPYYTKKTGGQKLSVHPVHNNNNNTNRWCMSIRVKVIIFIYRKNKEAFAVDNFNQGQRQNGYSRCICTHQYLPMGALHPFWEMHILWKCLSTLKNGKNCKNSTQRMAKSLIFQGGGECIIFPH